MTDREIVESQIAGFEFLCTQARNITLLPLEEWLNALNRAEALVPFPSPNIPGTVSGSELGQVLKRIIEAAIPLKREVLKAQTAVKNITL